MRFTFVAVMFAASAASGVAYGLEFPGSCRGPKGTVRTISGIDTTAARIVASHTRADAIDYCSSELNPGRERRPREAQLGVCVDRFMNEYRGVVSEARANCRAGTLVTGARGPRATWNRPAYKFPIESACGGDNMQAIAVFK